MAPTQRQAQDRRARQLASGGKKAGAVKARVARYLKSQEPQLREPAKSSLLLKGRQCSANMGSLLKELRAMQAPNTKLLSKKNAIDALSVDGQQSLEFLMRKSDCSLVALASNSKKRPNNLIMGRTFDGQILDLCEFSVVRFKSCLSDYGGAVPKKWIGSKPLLLFCGDAWQSSEAHGNLQNLLIDFYRGQVVDQLVVSGVDHVMMFTLVVVPSTASGGVEAPKPRLHQRTYHVQLKKNPNAPSSNNSSPSVPVPYLEPCGPDIDFVVSGRSQWAEAELYRAARRQPTALKKRTKKNQSTNVFGETLGRLHLEKQDLDHRQGRKSKALRRAEKLANEEEKEALEGELQRESEQLGREFHQQFGFEETEMEQERGRKK